jgi:hypothetical protein
MSTNREWLMLHSYFHGFYYGALPWPDSNTSRWFFFFHTGLSETWPPRFSQGCIWRLLLVLFQGWIAFICSWFLWASSPASWP